MWNLLNKRETIINSQVETGTINSTCLIAFTTSNASISTTTEWKCKSFQPINSFSKAHCLCYRYYKDTTTLETKPGYHKSTPIATCHTTKTDIPLCMKNPCVSVAFNPPDTRFSPFLYSWYSRCSTMHSTWGLSQLPLILNRRHNSLNHPRERKTSSLLDNWITHLPDIINNHRYQFSIIYWTLFHQHKEPIHKDRRTVLSHISYHRSTPTRFCKEELHKNVKNWLRITSAKWTDIINKDRFLTQVIRGRENITKGSPQHRLHLEGCTQRPNKLPSIIHHKRNIRKQLENHRHSAQSMTFSFFFFIKKPRPFVIQPRKTQGFSQDKSNISRNKHIMH